MTIAKLSPLQKIPTEGGAVLKTMQKSNPDFYQIEEAYFSKLNPYAIRAWKRHTQMTVNAIVPFGSVKFVIVTSIFDNNSPNVDPLEFEEYVLDSGSNYSRLTIPPNTWFGFQAGTDGGLILNLANFEHQIGESETKSLSAFDYRHWYQ